MRSLGELLGFARCRSHQQRYCDWISSLRQLGGGSDGSDSWTLKWSRMRHELDHQLYLVFAAITFWVRTALRTREDCLLSNVRHVLCQMGDASYKGRVGTKLSSDS